MKLIKIKFYCLKQFLVYNEADGFYKKKEVHQWKFYTKVQEVIHSQ